jgi:hypothetical protein
MRFIVRRLKEKSSRKVQLQNERGAVQGLVTPNRMTLEVPQKLVHGLDYAVHPIVIVIEIRHAVRPAPEQLHHDLNVSGHIGIMMTAVNENRVNLHIRLRSEVQTLLPEQPDIGQVCRVPHELCLLYRNGVSLFAIGEVTGVAVLNEWVDCVEWFGRKLAGQFGKTVAVKDADLKVTQWILGEMF